MNAEQLYADAAQLYAELAPTEGPGAAARAADYGIAYEAAKRRLAKRGIRRNPTEAEVNRILQKM